uniref:Ankyrin repeat and SOCS box containing 15b n=1 Tax=Eptatretus burgeri TaxID=7764 RepID=A0A8C4NAU3_EPTBU
MERTLKGETALFLAVQAGNMTHVQALLDLDFDPNVHANNDETPLYAAVKQGSRSILRLLLTKGAEVDKPCRHHQWTALHEAAKLGRTERTSYGFTPLAVAAQYGKADVMELLLRKGADVQAQATDGASALYEAANYGDPACTSLLLQYGADVNLPKHTGHLPIHRSAFRGHLLVLEMLLPLTKRKVVYRSGISPLHSAAADGHSQCVKLLLSHGYSVNYPLAEHVAQNYDDQRRSALYFAVSNGDLNTAHLLLEAGAKTNLDPVNVLLVAVRHGNHAMVQLLLEHGADANCYVLVNTTRFPSAIQYALRDQVLMRILLNGGYQAEACFTCSHNDPQADLTAKEDCCLPGWSSSVICDTEFCELLTLSWTKYLAGTVVQVLLDYVDYVPICTKLQTVLEQQKEWPDIQKILGINNMCIHSQARSKSTPPGPLIFFSTALLLVELGLKRTD